MNLIQLVLHSLWTDCQHAHTLKGSRKNFQCNDLPQRKIMNQVNTWCCPLCCYTGSWHSSQPQTTSRDLARGGRLIISTQTLWCIGATVWFSSKESHSIFEYHANMKYVWNISRTCYSGHLEILFTHCIKYARTHTVYQQFRQLGL